MRDDHLTQLRKGALELAVLALLRRAPSYGIEIVEGLAARPGLEASTGTIYPLLTRLRNAGLVDTVWRESPKGPPRKYYSLSRRGAEALRDQARSWHELAGAMDSLLTEETQP